MHLLGTALVWCLLFVVLPVAVTGVGVLLLRKVPLSQPCRAGMPVCLFHWPLIFEGVLRPPKRRDVLQVSRIWPRN